MDANLASSYAAANYSNQSRYSKAEDLRETTEDMPDTHTDYKRSDSYMESNSSYRQPYNLPSRFKSVGGSNGRITPDERDDRNYLDGPTER